jgi:hypothetical protein
MVLPAGAWVRRVVVVLACVGPGPVQAADTLETWAKGDSNAEVYVGLDGLASRGRAGSLQTDLLVGHGLTNRLSVYVGSALASPSVLAVHDAGFYVGSFAALLDTDHLDVDFLLDLTAQGDGFRELVVLPFLEVNLDMLPDQAGVGLYAHLALPVTASEASLRGTPRLRPGRSWTDLRSPWAPLPPLGLQADLAAKVGAYWTVRPGHQVLCELDATFPLLAPARSWPPGVGTLALGYNFHLGGSLESINQLTLGIPAHGQFPSAAFTTGFILGIPTSSW